MKSPVVKLSDLKDKVYSVHEVASILGVCTETIKRRIRSGVLPARTIRGENTFVIYGDDLAVYLRGEPATTRPKVRETTKALIRQGDDKEAVVPFRLDPSVVSRLNAWIQREQLQLKDLAKKTGIPACSLSRITRLEWNLTRTNLEKIRKGYGEDLYHYLLTGDEKAAK